MSLTICWFLVACGPGSPDKADEGASTGGADEVGTGATGPGATTTTASASTTGEPTTTDPTTTDPSASNPSAPGPTTQEPDPDPQPDGPWPPLTMWPVTELSLQAGELDAFAELQRFVPEPILACPIECEGNGPPTLGEPIFFVNGAWTETLDLHVGDRVGVVFGYADPDCDLVCGWISSGASGPQETLEGGEYAPNLPCASGPGLGIDFTTLEAAGSYTWWIQIEDVCEAKAAAKGGFEVAP